MSMFVYEGGRGVKNLEKMATWFVHDPLYKSFIQYKGHNRALYCVPFTYSLNLPYFCNEYSIGVKKCENLNIVLCIYQMYLNEVSFFPRSDCKITDE